MNADEVVELADHELIDAIRSAQSAENARQAWVFWEKFFARRHRPPTVSRGRRGSGQGSSTVGNALSLDAPAG